MSDDVHITVNDVPLGKVLKHSEAVERRTESETLRQQEIKERSYRKPVTGGMRPMRKIKGRLPKQDVLRLDKRTIATLKYLPKTGITLAEFTKRSGTTCTRDQVRDSIRRCGGKFWKEKKYQGVTRCGLVVPAGHKERKRKHQALPPVSTTTVEAEIASVQPGKPTPIEVESISASVVVTSLENIMKTVCDAQLAFWTTFKKGLEERDATSKDPKTDA